MYTLDKLIALFETFPGVGGRQAKRFAFHVLTMSDNNSAELSRLIAELKGSVVKCDSCHRFYTTQCGTICSICNSANRDHNRLLIVAHDSDIQAIERAGMYDGLYFVFGGTVPLLSSADNNKKLRGGLLKVTVEKRLPEGLTEVIIGFSVNPDGENTALFVESIIGTTLKENNAKITHLGRGLSTGSELEYADPETIKSALRNRS